MTEQFEWIQGGPGSLTYLVKPTLGRKNGNVPVKAGAGTAGHVEAATTSRTVSGIGSAQTRRTSPSGSRSDCFRCIGRIHPLSRAEHTTPASVRARRVLGAPPPGGVGEGTLGLGVRMRQGRACAASGSRVKRGCGVELSSGERMTIARAKKLSGAQRSDFAIQCDLNGSCYSTISHLSLVLGPV